MNNCSVCDQPIVLVGRRPGHWTCGCAKKKKPAVDGRVYDKSGFVWALMYRGGSRGKPYITRIYMHGRDAQREAVRINRDWERHGFGNNHWTVQRFMFRYKGQEIDAYLHEWERTEKA